ncbi:MAG TPA: LamG domain-containing protein [Sedimentisphaerales bacterium]|nr:LamG domain-containing protein [Sedimentisphaerales bacterium]
MYRNLIWLFSFILVLSMAGNVSAELVGYWNFDEGSGAVAVDSSGNGNDGTFNGDPQWVVGYFGRALEFDGSDDWLDCGNNPTLEITTWTITFWVNVNQNKDYNGFITKGLDAAENYEVLGFADGSFHLPISFTNGTRTWPNTSTGVIVVGEWAHFAYSYDSAEGRRFYKNGSLIFEDTESGTPQTTNEPLTIGNERPMSRFVNGVMDDIRIYNHVLTEPEILAAMEGGQGYPYALGPSPKDGALYAGTWATISWRPGDFAVSHDVYIGENFNDVNNGTGETFRGNQTLPYFVAGIPEYPYPDGLVPGTTYYWRIDEVNEADPNSPWKGDVWSFSIPPKTAYYPDPADGAEFVDLNVQLSWTAGFGAKLHYIFFGEDFDEVSSAVTGTTNGTADYNPGPLNLAKTYYWRVDEFDGTDTYKGEVWSFTTEGAVSGPNPADGAVDVKPSVVLSWDAGAVAASHDVYFGTDADAVKNATTTSPEYKGAKALGEESYAPGKLTFDTTYHWRIDEVNDVNPDSPWAGNVWSFTTGDFFVIDDFEDYDANDNQIWYAWHDGLGYGTPGTADYFGGNGTGAAVGDETTASYTEETIVHGGGQSMPVMYDNNKQGYAYYSEVEYTLTDQQDWTEEDVTELSLLFRGYPGSVGSFVESPVGTYTMTASGADIWNVNGVEADEFHFAYKMLNGAGSIIARVNSVENTNVWAKAGVMIRETLDPDSAHAFACVTPGSGVSFQRRPGTGQTSTNTDTGSITTPYWVKLERSISGLFTASHSANGSTWTVQGTETISMGANVYVGLALTSHDAALTCQAVFSNVMTTATVGQQWAHQDIGIASNAAEPLYVAVSNSAGTPAVVVHDDPAAAQIDTWTEWVIPLQAFADQGIVLTNVDRIAIGLGTRGNTTIPGGSGKMYFDDIRLYRPGVDAAE